MKSVMALVLAGSGIVVAQDAVQWRVEDGGNGHWYQLVVSGSIQWFDARDAASEAGGYLASSTSPNEDSFLVDLANRSDNPQAWIDDFGGNALGPYLGAYQPVGADPSQPWAWVSGEPWSWVGWASTEPNGGFAPGETISGQLGFAGSDFYRGWFDGNINDSPPYPLCTSYIIEWSSDCNNDGIVDYGQTLDGSLIDFDENGVPDICEARQWTTSEGGNGHWYQVIVLGQGTTTEKLAYARTVGADLASLVTPEEFDFAAFTVCDSPTYWIEDENGCLCGGPAIGGYRAPESDFSWLDGSVWDYSPWHGGNPDGASSDAQLVRLWDYFGNRRFVDHRLLGETGADIQSVLLEWSSDCNGDGIVDYGQILDGSLMDQDGNGVPDGCAEVACCIGSTCIFSTALSCEQAGGTFENSDAGCSSQVCQSDCPGDITDDGQVDFTDLLIIVSTWGPCSDG